jgi:hypothetical protein
MLSPGLGSTFKVDFGLPVMHIAHLGDFLMKCSHQIMLRGNNIALDIVLHEIKLHLIL